MDVSNCFTVRKNMNLRDSRAADKTFNSTSFYMSCRLNDGAKIQHFSHFTKYIFYVSRFCRIFAHCKMLNIKIKKTMKRQLTTENIEKGLVLGKVNLSGWSLCIGAGTSQPVFPSWKELVNSLIHDINPDIRPRACKEVMNSFSYDTLIQAAYTLTEQKENFAQYLQKKLYSKLEGATTSEELDCLRFVFTQVTANRFEDEVLVNYIKVRDRLFKSTSAYVLARIVKDATDMNLQPKSIMSFNAESLLYSLIISFEREPYIGKSKKKKDVKEILDMVTSSTCHCLSGRTPYIFCHGALLEGLREGDYYNMSQGTPNLVFSESSYINLANKVFSWQSSNFLHYCSSSVVIFVGISFTDPNIRKWLTWIQTERSLESGKEGTLHYWINVKPRNVESMAWIEASVWHLGVRIIWMNSWDELDYVIRMILALPPYDK